MPAVEAQTHRTLARIAAGQADCVAQSLELREAQLDGHGLDRRTDALVRIAALIALDGPPASYARQVADAVAAGASAEDMLGVLRAVAPEVGDPRAVAAAPEIMLALGLTLPGDPGPGAPC